MTIALIQFHVVSLPFNLKPFNFEYLSGYLVSIDFQMDFQILIARKSLSLLSLIDTFVNSIR